MFYHSDRYLGTFPIQHSTSALGGTTDPEEEDDEEEEIDTSKDKDE